MNDYIKEAFKESVKAYKKGEIPVGAIIVKNGKIVSRGHNDRQNNHSVIGHAEINCILRAEKKLKDWRLDGCELYVTMKPCTMCNSIIRESRIERVYYLADNGRYGLNDKCQEIEINGSEDLKMKYIQMLKNFFDSFRK